LYPRVYFPDLTTRASLAEIDSEDLAALDFFVGAMLVGVGRNDCRQNALLLYSFSNQGSNSDGSDHMIAFVYVSEKGYFADTALGKPAPVLEIIHYIIRSFS